MKEAGGEAVSQARCRVPFPGENRKHLYFLEEFLPESQTQNLALTVLYVPYLVNSGGELWGLGRGVYGLGKKMG